MKILFLLFTLSVAGYSFCAPPPPPPEVIGGPINIRPDGIVDGVYVKEIIPTKIFLPDPYVRESDVVFEKRLWRTIDLREKMNHPLYYPLDDFSGSGAWVRHTSRWSLWTIIRTSVLEGRIVMYDPENPLALGTFDGDQFKYPLTAAPGKNYYTDTDFREKSFRMLGNLTAATNVVLSNMYGEDSMIYYPDGSSEPVYAPRDTIWYKSSDIVQYRLKEDWYFDKQRSVLDQRILGIAPVVYKYNSNKEIEGFRELFWIYFPYFRLTLNNYYVYNPQTNAQWMSFDDFFKKRLFSSTIYKQDNTYDRNIESFRSGVDALIESDKITNKLRTWESDLWEF